MRAGDRVLVPFTIACGNCLHCRAGKTSLCDNSNPNAWMADLLLGYTCSGLYGYSHAFGGYPGGQAEYVRIAYADANAFLVPDGLADEQVLFLTDIFPTGYQAAEQADIQPGDTVAVWGCGPVGWFAIQSAFMLGAERVIAIDRIPYRLDRARALGADTIDFDREDVVETLKTTTAGRGPDKAIDCVGMEAHSFAPDNVADKVKQTLKLSFDRAHVLRQAIYAVGKGGVVSVPGVYAGLHRQVPDGHRREQGSDDSQRPDARAPVRAQAARHDPAGPHRPQQGHLARAAARRRARSVPDVRRQGRRLREGRAQARSAA